MSKTATKNSPRSTAKGADSQEPNSLAQACKAASDPLRLQILRVLRAESFGVLELCQILDLAQPKLSHHLKVLAKAELVATRREGNSIFYRRPLLDSKNPLIDFIHSLFTTVDREPLSDKISQRIAAIKAERSRLSLDFFERNADKFRETQELIIEHAQYATNEQDLLKLANLPKDAAAIEIGPGEGGFLVALAQDFSQVYAIDNSQQMLDRAKQQATQHKLDNIEFILGETSEAIQSNITGDLVVFNMVLHHVPSPATLFQEAAQLLNPKGYMLVAELCHHDQEWVKESCGDLWLGFEPDELTHWAEASSLQPVQDLFLGLRNGFQVQLHLFQKH